MKLLLTLSLILFTVLPILGINTDSLNLVIKQATNDTVKINSYINWQKLLTPNDREENYKINLKILKISETNLKKKNLSKKEKDYFELKKGRSYSLIGRYFMSQAEYSKSIEYFSKSLKIFKRKGENYEIANCYNNIGVVNIYKGNYPEALKYSLKALNIREEMKDTFNLAASYNNIGYLYMILHKYDLSLKYNQNALSIYKKLKMEQDVGGIYINIGILYRNQNKNDEALKYYLMALPIKEKGNDKSKLGDLYSNISVVYSSLKNIDLSLKYGEMALKIHEEINNKTGLTSSLANLASAYINKKQYSKAKVYLERSLEISKQLNQKMTLSHIYLSLTSVDSALGNYQLSLANYKKHIIYRDSLYSEDNTRKAVEAEMQYEFAKDSVENAKQKQLDDALIAKQKSDFEKQNSELKAKKNQQYYLLFGLIMVFVFSGFLYNRFRIISKQNKIIEKQKKEVELQKHMVDEKQKEILDSINYAHRLQQAILAPEKEIKQYFKESFLLFKPKDIVAGDFYFFEKQGNNIFYAACDCTGHGVPGAMVSIVCSNALSRCIKEFKLTDPGLILDKTRELVIETFEKSGEIVKDGMDISFLHFQITDNSISNISWAGANNPIWYIENNELKEIKPNKQPIGKTENPSSFFTHTLPLSLKSLYLFTDGFADQFGGPKGKKFKYSNLQKLLLDLNPDKLETQKLKLESTFNNWKGDLEQVDDVCIVGIKF